MRILITGSRDYRDLAMIETAIASHLRLSQQPGEKVTVVHGGARGADTLASTAARYYGLDEEAHLAKWRTHGKAAGPIRNQHMVDLGADICLAFPTPSSRGTWDCVGRARAAGITVRIYEESKQ